MYSVKKQKRKLCNVKWKKQTGNGVARPHGRGQKHGLEKEEHGGVLHTSNLFSGQQVKGEIEIKGRGVLALKNKSQGKPKSAMPCKTPEAIRVMEGKRPFLKGGWGATRGK